MLRSPSRRGALALPLLLVPGARAAAARLPAEVPPFPAWVGRTALLNGDGGAARVLLAADGGGVMSVKLFLFCRTVPIMRWEQGADGLLLRYARPSVLDARRVIEGEAEILPGRRELRWVEARAHLAEFEGFAAPDAAGRCG
ncbi:hypothetical protein [Falsiroseomonas sp. CW058]|uniref:hypothetical protein n=1 Tax=Falsiroseomonas sp. CW058 TaxID=3388664 RepID=UPI003D316551